MGEVEGEEGGRGGEGEGGRGRRGRMDEIFFFFSFLFLPFSSFFFFFFFSEYFTHSPYQQQESSTLWLLLPWCTSVCCLALPQPFTSLLISPTSSSLFHFASCLFLFILCGFFSPGAQVFVVLPAHSPLHATVLPHLKFVCT